jgi:hypothetical protein
LPEALLRGGEKIHKLIRGFANISKTKTARKRGNMRQNTRRARKKALIRRESHNAQKIENDKENRRVMSKRPQKQPRTSAHKRCENVVI